MTTSHKIVLSLVAAICITLIVFYSVQGNAQHGNRQREVTTPAAVTTTDATGTANPLDAATPPAAKVVQTPVIVGRAENPHHTGLDDLVAKVRTELATTEPAPARGNAAPVTATEPTEPTGPIASANAPAVTQPAPTTEAQPVPTTPSANAVAQVPTFTLSEPAKELPAPGGASVAAGAGPKMPYDINLRDLADMPVVDGPLVPLVRVRSNDEPVVKSETAPAGVVETPVKPAASVATDTTPAVIVVDPHQPAVKAADPVIKDNEPAVGVKPAGDLSKNTGATTGADLIAPAIKAATNSQAEAPRPTTPAKPAAAPVVKTYTIKSGDSFSSIATAELGAEKHWIDIADANPGVDPKRIRVGQVINLPDIDKDDAAVTAIKPVKPEVTATAPPVKPETVKTPVGDVPVVTNIHEVKAGENLSNISRRYFNTPDHWRHIYVTNREIIGGDPGKLQAGLKLKITTPPKSN